MNSVGLYVHIPFCERVCPYCDFAVVQGLPGAREGRTVNALLAELQARASEFPGAQLATVYLGGGTPSLLRAESVAHIIGAARAAFPSAKAPAEITLEVNPGSSERGRFAEFRAAGVTRLSIGVQSFCDETLRRLGRAHQARECEAALNAARAAGFTNISLDLLFAAPGQTLQQLQTDAARAVAFAPEHISTYALTLEGETPMARAAAAGRLSAPCADAAAEMMRALNAQLCAAGYVQYELSNYARAGFQARHNARYWRREAVLGIGPSAHSYLPLGAPGGGRSGARPANERAFINWLARIESGNFAPPHSGLLMAREARAEAVFLALRRREGLSARTFAAEFGAPPRVYFGAALARLCAAKLLRENSAGDLALTARGRMLADTVGGAFV